MVKMIKDCFVGICVCLTSALCLSGEEYNIPSPDGRLRVTVTDEDGVPGYGASLDGNVALARSPLGLFIDGVEAAEVTKLKPYPVSGHEVSYVNGRGKCSHVSKPYNEQRFGVDEGGYDIVFRVFDDGFAYRYELLPSDGGSPRRDVRVIAENSGFKFPAGSRGWLTQLAKAKEGWCGTAPSYEDHYHINVPVEEKSDERQGWIFPALIRNGKVWTLVTESGHPGEYPGCHLSEAHDNTFMVEFPHADHNLRQHPVWAQINVGGHTPWRVVAVGDSQGDILETTLADDLADDAFVNDMGLKPGKASWSWLYHADAWTTYEGQRKFIDLAATLGLEYCLTDALWDVNIGRERMAELAAYAREKNVGLLLWYNSNGNWNNAPQSPFNCFNTREARQREMKWLKDIGASGVKIDFFGGDKQAGMQLYEDILCDADSFGLVVNFHGATLPRGWSRLHPSYMNSEAVFGQEMCRGAGPNEAARPRHCTVLPFVRNAVGPMDFTPVVLNRRLAWIEGADDDAAVAGEATGEVFRDADNAALRVTTDAFELALPVIFFEPLKHFGITVADLPRYNETVWRYIREVPTVWDSTSYIAGMPGEYVAIARRSGNDCYVAAINGSDTPVTISLEEWGCGLTADYLLTSDASGNLTPAVFPALPASLTLAPRDGFVYKFSFPALLPKN